MEISIILNKNLKIFNLNLIFLYEHYKNPLESIL